MPSSVTITGALGPGQEVTALVMNNATAVNFDLRNNSLGVAWNDNNGSRNQTFALTGTTTATVTVSGSTWTFVLT